MSHLRHVLYSFAILPHVNLGKRLIIVTLEIDGKVPCLFSKMMWYVEGSRINELILIININDSFQLGMIALGHYISLI